MITFGIPTYNEEKVIINSINSILSQMSKDDEVIVVASGCTDRTVPLIKARAKKDKRIKLIVEKERKGKSSALNLIIKNAKSDLIVQTDGDVNVDSSAIRELLKHFKDKKIGAVSGNPIPIIPKNNLFYDWTIMSYRKIGEIRKKEMENKTFNIHLSGYLLAFRKKALPRVPFAKGAIDALMGIIIEGNGYKLTYEPNAKVYVKTPTTIHDFIIQKARVRAGYYNLPKMPRKISKEFLWLPTEFIKIPFWRWHKFIASGFVYLYSWMKGLYLAKTNKSLEQIWKTPKTTKI